MLSLRSIISGVTESKPRQVSLQDLLAQMLVWTEQKLVLILWLYITLTLEIIYNILEKLSVNVWHHLLKYRIDNE